MMISLQLSDYQNCRDLAFYQEGREACCLIHRFYANDSPAAIVIGLRELADRIEQQFAEKAA